MSNQKKPKKHWVKRSLKALFIPLILLIFSGVLLNISDIKSIQKIDDVLNLIWLPTTLFRLFVYIILSFVVLPIFLRRSQKNNQNIIFEIKNEMNVQISDDDEDDMKKFAFSKQLKNANAQAKIYRYLFENKWVFLAAFIVFDLLTLQIPYFLR